MGKILVTGGAGFIGSHTVVELLQSGQQVVVVDNFCNSSPVVLKRITEITGQAPEFVEADIRDQDALRQVFASHRPEAVIHFAGLKAVGESVEKPLAYYQNNICGTATLCEVMAEYGKGKLKIIGINDRFGQYGELDELLVEYGLTAENIEKISLELLENS